MHDAAIVGASVAGAATAIHLARAGHSVVLLDRATFPRRKVCGEGLFPAGAAQLASLGVLDRLADAARPLRGVRFNAGNHQATAHFSTAGPSAIGVQREVLDAALLDAARAAGVEVCTGVTARALVVRERRVAAVETDHGPIEARAFVAADGLGSRLRRLARLDASPPAARYGVAAHVRLAAAPEPYVDVTFGSGHEAYLTPVGGCDANLALLLRRDAMRAFAGDVETPFRAAVGHLPALADGYELLDVPRAAGPFPVRCSRAWRANLVLAGDAAGFFDGISGEGMSVALVSARDCARAVAAYLDGAGYDSFRRYDRRRRALVRNSDLLARVSLLLGGSPALARIAVRNLGRRPGTFDRLLAVSSGERSLHTLPPRDLAALLAGL